MPTLAVRPETGATISPGPMVTAPPGREVVEDHLTEFAAGCGLGGPFLADQLSAFVTHERMGINLLRTLYARCDNPVLRKRYADLEDETLRAIEVWEQLITRLGGNPQYASPAARATEAFDSKAIEALALSGSADPMSLEQAGLQTFLCAANQCVANVALLAELADAADEGQARVAMREAAETLRPVAESHQRWAMEAIRKATVSQAKHPAVRKVAQAAERATDKIRSAFR